jgi:hypothetical protein
MEKRNQVKTKEPFPAIIKLMDNMKVDVKAVTLKPF